MMLDVVNILFHVNASRCASHTYRETVTSLTSALNVTNETHEWHVQYGVINVAVVHDTGCPMICMVS